MTTSETKKPIDMAFHRLDLHCQGILKHTVEINDLAKRVRDLEACNQHDPEVEDGNYVEFRAHGLRLDSIEIALGMPRARHVDAPEPEPGVIQRLDKLGAHFLDVAEKVGVRVRDHNKALVEAEIHLQRLDKRASDIDGHQTVVTDHEERISFLEDLAKQLNQQFHDRLSEIEEALEDREPGVTKTRYNEDEDRRKEVWRKALAAAATDGPAVTNTEKGETK